MYVIVPITKQANKAGKNVYLAIVNPTNNASIEVAKACVNIFLNINMSLKQLLLHCLLSFIIFNPIILIKLVTPMV